MMVSAETTTSVTKEGAAMPPVAVIDQITRKAAWRATPTIAFNSHPAPVDCGLFAGVADWPPIDEVFAARSLSILASGGISAWYGAGGRRGYDGRLGFGAVSSPALEIVKELADTFGGFRWTDDAGATWAVRFAHDEGHDPDRRTFAVTYRGCVWVIDSKRRRPALHALRTQVARCSQPARSWDDADRAKYGLLTRALHSLRLVDGAERILIHLQHHAEVEQVSHVLLSAEELGSVVKPADEEITHELSTEFISQPQTSRSRAAEPVPTRAPDAKRPRATAADGPCESTVAAIHRSENGGGEGAISGKRPLWTEE
jgi:hypothetical protein